MMYPDVWGHGSLFVFSGLDGKNTYTDSLAGTLCADRLGILFHLKKRVELSLALKGVCDISYKIVASDIIMGEFTARGGGKAPFIIAFCSQDTVAGLTGECARPVIRCDDVPAAGSGDGVAIACLGGEYAALAVENGADGVRFAFSFSRESENDAAAKAKEALKLNIRLVAKERLAFFEKLPHTSADQNVEKTLGKCFSVMKSQVYSPEGLFQTRWTTPDRLPHRRLWLWDSVFHSFGNRYISADLAYESIRAVLDTQAEDGFIPHMAAPPAERSDITQPPVLAWGLYDLYSYSGEKDYLTANYEKLKKYLCWNIQNRDSDRNFLYEWMIEENSVNCRCGECGMDNSPRFDNVVKMDCIDFSCFMANEARCMSKIADALDMPDEKDYWTGLYGQIKQAVNDSLWDEADGFYYDRVLADGRLKKVKAVSSFLPLFAGICDKRQAKRLVRHLSDSRSFYTKLPVPSISADDPAFGSDMWRGPVWINYNYMIIRGLREYGYNELAEDIRSRTVEAIAFWYKQEGTVYEFYDSTDRIPPKKLNRKGGSIEPYDFGIRCQSIRDYGWSCALFAALLLEER